MHADEPSTKSISSGAKFQFAGTGSALSRAKLTVGKSGDARTHVVVTTGIGKIEGVSEGWILAESSDHDVLILGSNNKMEGLLDIEITLVNHGTVRADSAGDKIKLRCEPKCGSGDWLAGGGDTNDRGQLIIDTLVVGSGDVTIDDGGHLIVNRHFAVIEDAGTSRGDFFHKQGGKLTVGKNILFEVNRFGALCGVVIN